MWLNIVNFFRTGLSAAAVASMPATAIMNPPHPPSTTGSTNIFQSLPKLPGGLSGLAKKTDDAAAKGDKVSKQTSTSALPADPPPLSRESFLKIMNPQELRTNAREFARSF